MNCKFRIIKNVKAVNITTYVNVLMILSLKNLKQTEKLR